MKKNIFATTLIVTAFLSAALPVSAEPNFGTCLNPQWSLSQENYSSNAQHGVVGIGGFAGTDKIYKSGSDVLQCLCTPEGKGYQTNWMKASHLSDNDVKVYKNNGWIHVTTGASYGLDDSPYLAKNSEYSCTVGGKGGGETTSNAIEALAKTGNMSLILGLFIAGAAFLIGGVIVRRINNKS